MLHIDNITVTIQSNIILENLSLQIEEGSIVGIVGLNGAGKTTLLNSIFGLIPSQKGNIIWKGKPISSADITFIQTENFFYSNITGKEYLSIFKKMNPFFRIDKWNQLFELPLNQLIESYSTGMKKKLALMAGIGMNRKVIILDEPFNGLDLQTNQLMKKIIAMLKEQGKTIIITSHILEVLFNICDAICLLENKHIEATFSKNEFENIEKRVFSDFDQKISQLLNDLFSNS